MVVPKLHTPRCCIALLGCVGLGVTARAAPPGGVPPAGLYKAGNGPYEVGTLELVTLYDRERDRDLQLRITYAEGAGPGQFRDWHNRPRDIPFVLDSLAHIADKAPTLELDFRQLKRKALLTCSVPAGEWARF